jgi:carboxyl-terminal processing protease
MDPTSLDRPSDDAALASPDPGAPAAEPPAPAADPTVVSAPAPMDDQPAFVVAPTPVRARRRWRGPVVAVAVFLVAVMAGGALFVGGFALGSQRATTAGTASDLQTQFQPFWEAWDAITQQYPGDVDRHKLIEGAIGGLFTALGDPYSSYMTSEEYKASLEGVTGQFEGIGAEIGTEATDGSGSCTPISATCHMVVVSPLDGSPAETAGLKAGDVVTEIDGTSTNGLTLDDAVNKVRGPRGTQVVLTITRKGSTDPIELTITRDVIVVKDVTAKLVENDKVGYIKVAHFSANVGKDFEAALKDQIAKGVTSFVLDMRGDPGGFVPEAVSVASEFLGPDKVVFWEEYAGGRQQDTKANANGVAVDPKYKLVVLVDKGSASAAEIVAAALQENGRAELVGATTFGKGTVQVWQLLSQDTGGFRLTVAKWLTPDKNWINSKGITPDVAVSAEGAAQGTDPVLAKALQVLQSESAGALAPAA